MSISTYKNKIEEYINKKESSSKELDSARGLLAPKGMSPKEVKQQKDITATIGDFVFALRQKRKEIKMQKGKK